MLPGLALTNIAPGVTGVLLMIHSLGLCALETILYWQGEGMYPSALFCATAALGFALSRRLEHDKRITPTVGWILRCVYLSKGAVVVVPNVWAYPAALFVTLCVSPLFMEGEGRGRAVSLKQNKTLFVAQQEFLVMLKTSPVSTGSDDGGSGRLPRGVDRSVAAEHAACAAGAAAAAAARQRHRGLRGENFTP